MQRDRAEYFLLMLNVLMGAIGPAVGTRGPFDTVMKMLSGFLQEEDQDSHGS